MGALYSLVLNHTPWNVERAACKLAMTVELCPLSRGVPFLLNDRDFRGRDWQEAKVEWALDQWRWSMQQDTKWHVFMTDDLHLAPGFHDLLTAILQAADGESAVGLLANSPKATLLAEDGHRFYRTNSWLVGPCYALSHELLVHFLAWYEKLPEGPPTQLWSKAWANDDSNLNEFITRSGRSSVHPLPTIIEHRVDVASTTGHGDRYSRERLSWRAVRNVVEGEDNAFAWVERHRPSPLEDMKHAAWWGDPRKAPLINVGT